MDSLIPTLETPRLQLRAFDVDDCPVVQKLAGNRMIAATTLNIPHPYVDGLAERWISTHREEFIKGTAVTWAIVQKEDSSLIGSVSLMGISAKHQAELGYWLGESSWNLGYCSEACDEVIRYAFEVLELQRVHACHFANNPASGRVLKKLGMRYEGCRKKHILKWGEMVDLDLYGLLREDWKQLLNR